MPRREVDMWCLISRTYFSLRTPPKPIRPDVNSPRQIDGATHTDAPFDVAGHVWSDTRLANEVTPCRSARQCRLLGPAKAHSPTQ